MITLILTTLLKSPWRRYRRHFLSVAELAQQPDLTISEFRLVAQIQHEVNAAARVQADNVYTLARS